MSVDDGYQLFWLIEVRDTEVLHGIDNPYGEPCIECLQDLFDPPLNVSEMLATSFTKVWWDKGSATVVPYIDGVRL